MKSADNPTNSNSQHHGAGRRCSMSTCTRLNLVSCAIELENLDGQMSAFVMHGCQSGSAHIRPQEIQQVIEFLGLCLKKPARPISNKRLSVKGQIHPSADRLMRIDEVIQITGLGKTSIYALGNAGKFPPRIKISSRAVAWSKNAVDSWLNSV